MFCDDLEGWDEGVEGGSRVRGYSIPSYAYGRGLEIGLGDHLVALDVAQAHGESRTTC